MMDTMLAATMITEREWFVGWGTLALINAGLAQGKNRSGFWWFVLSVFLGPLATFILLLMVKKPYVNVSARTGAKG